MGLFDNMFGKNQEITLTHSEAFAGLIFAAMAIDGHIAQEEVETLVNVLRQKKMFARYTPQQFQNMFSKLNGILKKQGPKQMVDMSVGSLPDDMREPAFAVVVDVVLSDGIVEEEEKQLLNDLQLKLNIDDELATKIAEVMMIRNQG